MQKHWSPAGGLAGRVRVPVCALGRSGWLEFPAWQHLGGSWELLLRADALSAHLSQFPDIVEFSEAMANAGKTVIVAALDGTFQRKVRHLAQVLGWDREGGRAWAGTGPCWSLFSIPVPCPRMTRLPGLPRSESIPDWVPPAAQGVTGGGTASVPQTCLAS